MLTHCPACKTHFRVTPEQLKARSGRVRCGECQHVFNALDSLIEVVAVAPPIAVAEPLPPVEGPRSASKAETPQAGSDQNAEPPEPTVAPDTEALKEDCLLNPESSEAASESSVDPTPAALIPPGVEELPGGEEASDPPSPASPRRWPWAAGSALALIALVVQAVLAFRVELAVLWPETKPALIALCELVDCQVGLPSKVALMAIEASDLYPESAHPGRLTLTATLKNRAPFAQEFPSLELTLTDVEDKAIARKVLAPADYLPAKVSAPEGMPANGDFMVTVGVDPGAMSANGYRLYLFYP